MHRLEGRFAFIRDTSGQLAEKVAKPRLIVSAALQSPDGKNANFRIMA